MYPSQSRQKPPTKRWPLITLAVLLVVAGVAAVTFVLLPEDRRPTIGKESEPRTVEAARSVVELSFDRYMGGDYAGAWDLYSAEGKAAISRSEYVRLLTACPPTKLPYEIVSARLESEDRAVVVVKLLGVAQSYESRYEDAAWRLQPRKEGLAEFALGVDAAVAKRKARGGCK